MLNDENIEQLGRAAFEAYVKSVGGKTWDGNPIPGWDDPKMTDKVREGWIAAAVRIWEIIKERSGGHWSIDNRPLEQIRDDEITR